MNPKCVEAVAIAEHPARLTLDEAGVRVWEFLQRVAVSSTLNERLPASFKPKMTLLVL